MSADDHSQRVAAGTIACTVLSLVLTVPFLLQPHVEEFRQVGVLMPTPPEIYQGAYWGLITCTFIHLDWFHLLFNMLWLWQLGTVMERTIGSARWALFFAVAAFVSSGLQLAMGGWGFGMSGVVYAIFGFMWQARRRYDEFRIAASREVVVLMLVWLVACYLLTWLDWMRIANTAHLAGLVFGYAVAWTLAPRRLLAKRVAAWFVVTVLVAVTALSVFVQLRPSQLPARLAGAAVSRHDLAGAARWLRVYVWLEPHNAAAWRALTEVELQRGNVPSASQAFAHLVALEPEAAAEFEARLDHLGKPAPPVRSETIGPPK
jgi:membrane associated rhomboid family serine protease